MDFAQEQRRPTRHVVGFAGVVLMHLLVGYALVTGLARRVVEVVRAPIEAQIVEEVAPPVPPPESLPPPPALAPPPPSFVPPPEVVIARPPAPPPVITTTPEPPPPAPVAIAPPPAPVQAPPAPPAPAPAPAPAPGPVIVARPAIADVRACAPGPEDYPLAASRANATGTTKIRFTIDGAGKLVQADIVRPAGRTREHRMLDRVARDRLSQCTFTPGVDSAGRPVGGTFEVEYVWRLE